MARLKMDCVWMVGLLLWPHQVDSYAHDTILPHHTPRDCACAAWTANKSVEQWWGSADVEASAGTACALPANAVTPSLTLPEYSPADGWCLCATTHSDGTLSRAISNEPWFSWCDPPQSYPSQINLLLVNATAVVVNFVTNDGGARAACPVEAELRIANDSVTTTFNGFSTQYHDSEGGRVLSYHHVTLGSLEPRTTYSYRVRVNGTAGPAPPTSWVKTTGIKWCSGGNFQPGDPFGQGFDGGDAWCPFLPPDMTHDEQVTACERVCGAANASACAGFTLYPKAVNPKSNQASGECCFRTSTASKPAEPTSTAECYEKANTASCSATISEWSDWLEFKSLYSNDGRATRFALYADMGVFADDLAGAHGTHLPMFARHNIGNLVDDYNKGLIDFAVHSGDHAYEFEVADGSRGDGYMDAYSSFLAHTPWAPGWGNHEYLEEDRGNRLANITAGVIAERRLADGAATRWAYSIEIGLLHFLHLDLSPYWCRFSGCIGVDTCGVSDEWVVDASSDDPTTRYNFTGYRETVMAYARADLAAIDRSKTPWVIASAHYPLYETYDDVANQARAQNEADFGARGRGRLSNDPAPSKAQAIADFEPLLAEFGVDMFFAGHDHNYETTWPVYQGKVVQASYKDPKAPIHILSGSAGPPEWDKFAAAQTWTREPRLQVNSYSRLTLFNASVALFEQVANNNGTIVDSFTITQTRMDRSAPFPCFE